jgi:hypothetical protein
VSADASEESIHCPLTLVPVAVGADGPEVDLYDFAAVQLRVAFREQNR